VCLARTRRESAERPARKALLDALDVARFGSVHANLVAFVDERRNVHHQTGFECGGLHHGAGGGFLQRGLGLHNLQVHGVRQADADGLFVVEFDFHDGVGDQVVDRFAQLFRVHLHLLVRFRIHEVEIVALFVEVLEFDFVEDGAVDEFFGAEAVVDDGAGAEIFHARLHGTALVARGAMLGAVDGVEIAFVLNDHAGAKLGGFDAAHKFKRPDAAVTPCRDLIAIRNSRRQPEGGAWNDPRHAGRKSAPNAENQYKWACGEGSIAAGDRW
jgi:hypothetical protein